ncbi:MAG: hypothetical protein H6822_10220 [Planctomycetaceae bacterium]|nr:hypothetical protein [Planctomycetales bacterium]MCB9922548.1 hypothetical protein [Planctomycetaceae bacterium]
MAKRSTRPDAAAKRTQEAVDKLKTYYELGQRAVKLSKSTAGTYARGVITQLVEETGENQATINKCRQFAEMYTPADFKVLCQLRRPDGKPIGWGHVTKLLTVPVADKPLRKKLQVQAAKEGWTARRLNDEIQGKYESKLSGMGRKWKLPTSKQQALSQISQRSQQWLRWYEGLENAKGVSVADLPDDVRTRLKAVMRGIRRLEEATS